MTEKIMQQYERVRQSGVCNMFDYNCVRQESLRLECKELASLDISDYFKLLQNYNKLMAKFNVKQEVSNGN